MMRRRALVALALLITFTAVVRTAWLCDDAYITLRTVDNFVNGYGLRWNIGERVQSYTHPLWMFLLTVPYYFTREPYYTTLAVSLAVTLAMLILVGFVLAESPLLGALGLLALGSSHAFVSYSTSGLENPLSSLLLVWFVVELVGPRRLRTLTFIAALLLLTRQDFLILIGPVLLVEAAPLRGRALRELVIGGAPIVAWELFSLFYYGVPIPNTAYAKLTHHVAERMVLRQGLQWLWYTLSNDWPTVLVMLAAAVGLVRQRERWRVAAVVGIALFVGYCCVIGGDYSAGRFLVAPMVLALALAVRQRGKIAPAALGVVIASSLFLRVTPVAFGGNPDRHLPAWRHIWDDRAHYFPDTGLIHVGLGAHGPLIDWGRWGLAESKRPNRAIVFRAVGQYGYFAGPRIHVIDDLALCDPLLARLQPITESELMVGHLQRAIPDGYVESVGRANVIRDPSLKEFYGDLTEIIRGPLWSWSRLKKVAALNLGRYRPLLEGYEAAHPKHG